MAERNLSEFVRVYEGALSDALCDDIVRRFEADTAHHSGPGGVPIGAAHVDARSNWTELNIQSLDHWDDVLAQLLPATTRFSERYAEDC